MKFEALGEFRRDITRLRVLYEATTQAYDALHKAGKAVLRTPNHPKNVEFEVGAKTIKRPCKTVTYHARDVYPKTLRSVILVQAISIYEVFIVAIVAEAAKRNKDWLKDGKRLDLSHAELLTIAWNQGIESYILDKLLNGLTRGSLTDKRRFFQSKFALDLAPDQGAYEELEEIHDRRNLYVHRMGYPDGLYLRKHPNTGAQEDQKVRITDDYLEQVFVRLEGSARHISTSLATLYPKEIAPRYSIGSAPLTVSAPHLQIVTVRCLSSLALTAVRDKSRMLLNEVSLSNNLVWLAVVGFRVTFLVAGTSAELKPFFKQIALDEKADLIRIEQSFRIDRRNITRPAAAPADASDGQVEEAVAGESDESLRLDVSTRGEGP